MADNKKSVLLYCDLIHTVEKLSDNNAGLLFKHYLRYVNDLNPAAPNEILDLVFEPIKQQLKRDLKEWEKTKEGYSKGGKASAEKRSRLKQAEPSLTKSTVTVNVTDTVTVNDNVKVNDTVTKKKDLREIYFKDLENSQDFEAIARTLKIDLNFLKTFIPAFRLKAELEYKDWARFISHFKNYVLKQIENATKPTTNAKGDRFNKQESLKSMENLSRAVLRANNGGHD